MLECINMFPNMFPQQFHAELDFVTRSLDLRVKAQLADLRAAAEDFSSELSIAPGGQSLILGLQVKHKVSRACVMQKTGTESHFSPATRRYQLRSCASARPCRAPLSQPSQWRTGWNSKNGRATLPRLCLLIMMRRRMILPSAALTIHRPPLSLLE